jgi:hypothetical protein
MFKNIQSALAKFFTQERVLFLIIFIILAWGLLTYSGAKSLNLDGMSVGATGATGAPAQPAAPVDPTALPKPQSSAPGYALQPVANPSDLLPADHNSEWSALNPNSMKKGDVLMPDLLQAGYHIGLDTIGQTLRNANLQLRSDPIIPVQPVGPWNQSTIEPDVGRVPLEIGQGPQ